MNGIKANWEAAKQKAAEIRATYPPLFVPPVDVFEIAKNEGIEIIYFSPADDSENVSGLLEKDAKRVYLNADESPNRQAFTLAHELAHYFLDHKPNEYGVYWRDSFYQQHKPAREQEADYFAAELLMPRDLIENALTTYEISLDDATLLAKLFGVSKAAMAVRLKDLFFHGDTA